MFAILWIIIKIILIILLCILGLLLAGILVVLFVPFCYGAQLSWLERRANGAVKISWLFRLIMLCVEIRDNQISAKLLVFGRDLSERTGERKRSRKQEHPSKESPPKDATAGPEESRGKPSGETRLDQEHPQASEVFPSSAPERLEEKSEREESEAAYENGPDRRPGILGRLRALWRRGVSAAVRVWNKIRAAWDKIKSGKMKWDQWMEQYHDEKNQNSIRLLKREGIRILKRAAPKTVRANLRVGLGEPASTGLFLGAAACLMPMYEDAVCLEPDFENAVLEGDLSVRGRISIGTFALTAIRIWNDKNLRSLIKKMIR